MKTRRAVPPDVILLDLVMAKMDGVEALAELRNVAPSARVVVHSGLRSR